MAREATNTKGGLTGTPQADYRDFSKHKVDRTVADGEGEQNPARQCKVHTANKK
jgi:hypothetical protein